MNKKKEKGKRKLLSDSEKAERKRLSNKKHQKKYASVRRKQYKEDADCRRKRREQSRMSYRKRNGLTNDYAEEIDSRISSLESYGEKRSVYGAGGKTVNTCCFTRQEFSDVIGRSVKTVGFWVTTGKLPNPNHHTKGLGKTGVYTLGQVRQFCNILKKAGDKGSSLTSTMKGIIHELNSVVK